MVESELINTVTDVLDVMDAAATAYGIVRFAQAKVVGLAKTSGLLEAVAVEARAFEARRNEQTRLRLEALERQASDHAAFLAKVRDMVADDQYHRLHLNLEWEAIRETLHERRELLAHAAAGLSTPGLTINEKARIERALRQVDADDVIHFDRLARFDDPEFVPKEGNDAPVERQRSFHNARKRLLLASEKPLSKSSLTMAGCIAEDSGIFGGPILAITPLGRQLLEVLESYLWEKRNA